MAVFLFLFAFMGGLAGAIAYFAARWLFPGMPSRQCTRAALAAGLFTLGLPPVLYGIFRITSPPGAPASGALVPAAWVAILLAGITVGLFLAARQKASA